MNSPVSGQHWRRRRLPLIGSAELGIVNPDVFEEHGRPLSLLDRLENYRVALPADPDTLAVKAKIVRQLHCLRALEFNDLGGFDGIRPSDRETVQSRSL